MSDDLYFTRLRFTGSSGVAKLHGLAQVLQDCPQFLPQRIAEVDYMPEVRACMVRDECGGWREMEASEIVAADALLHRLFSGTAHAAAA